jgi:hypothetical protein
MAQFFCPFHKPVQFVLRHAEIVFENTTLPERGGLLVLTDTDPFADEVFRFLDAGIDVIRDLGVKQSTARKYRQRDHVKAALTGNQIGRHRHLAYFELLKLELAPKSLGRMGIRRNQFESLRLDYPFHKRIDSFIECGDEAQSEFWHTLRPHVRNCLLTSLDFERTARDKSPLAVISSKARNPSFLMLSLPLRIQCFLRK